MIGFRWRGKTHVLLKSVDGREARHPVERLFPLVKVLAAKVKQIVDRRK